MTYLLFSGNKDEEAAISTEDILEQKEKIREPSVIKIGEHFSRDSKGAKESLIRELQMILGIEHQFLFLRSRVL